MLKCHSTFDCQCLLLSSAPCVLLWFYCDTSEFYALNMPKAIKSDARSIMLKVKSFFEEEAGLQAPIIPFNQVCKRISATTGVTVVKF
uniref:Uncharacterized protein n=1 Tax=Bombyx mori TaxID=7091 RepID=A0A8R2C559_BOMMO|nr:uncharacterized protein LOC105841395 isoform X2 [Bombyx mori]